jgi:hypothetical protein
MSAIKVSIERLLGECQFLNTTTDKFVTACYAFSNLRNRCNFAISLPNEKLNSHIFVEPSNTALSIFPGAERTWHYEQVGTWMPGKVIGSKGNHRWTKEIVINSPLSIEYKYTLGSSERKGADANGSPLSIRHQCIEG